MEEKPKITGYAWRPGSQHKVAADVAAMEMNRLLEQNNQRIDADILVGAAESPTNPLHPEFEWDDTVAAREHRRQQARSVMNSIITVVEDSKLGKVVAPLMVSVEKPLTAGRKHDYATFAFAMTDEDLRAEVLRTALRELAAFKRKYATYSELAQVFAVIDRTMKKQFG